MHDCGAQVLVPAHLSDGCSGAHVRFLDPAHNHGHRETTMLAINMRLPSRATTREFVAVGVPEPEVEA